MSLNKGRPTAWRGTFPADDDERWKAAQLADAKKGIYWGKHGNALRRLSAGEVPATR